jgi:hypothetical protein
MQCSAIGSYVSVCVDSRFSVLSSAALYLCSPFPVKTQVPKTIHIEQKLKVYNYLQLKPNTVFLNTISTAVKVKVPLFRILTSCSFVGE